MPINLAPGVTVRVEPPVMPVVTAAPPTSTVTVLPVLGPPGPTGGTGPPGPEGPASGAGQVSITATAAEPLSGHRAVTRRPDGTVEYASNTTAGHLHAPLWVTLGAAAAGAPVVVLVYGTVTEPSWSWTPGPLYLGANGLITPTPPAAPGALFLAQIGAATSPTTAFIDRQASISLT